MTNQARPVSLSADGLAMPLTRLAQNLNNTTGIEIESIIDSDLHVPEPSIAVQLYRIAQEAMNNAVKHARAGHIRVDLKKDSGRLVLTVADDGIGIGPQQERQGHLGLHIMRYRADSVGAQLDIRRAEGGGTRVRCSVPLAE